MIECSLTCLTTAGTHFLRAMGSKAPLFPEARARDAVILSRAGFSNFLLVAPGSSAYAAKVLAKS